MTSVPKPNSALGAAVVAEQRELEVHEGAAARAVQADRLEHHALALLEHLAVGVAHHRRRLGRQHLVHGAAADLGQGLADQLLERPVDVQVAAFGVAREDHDGSRIEDRLELLPAEIHAGSVLN